FCENRPAKTAEQVVHRCGTISKEVLEKQLVHDLPSRSSTLLVKDELILLASPMFQAQIQICCCSIEELITKSVEDRHFRACTRKSVRWESSVLTYSWVSGLRHSG